MIKLINSKDGMLAVLKNDTHLSRWVEEHNSIQTDGLLDRILPLVKEGDWIVDAGANLGDWTVPLAKAVGSNGTVYAFEPMPITFACLAVNTRDLSNVVLKPYGLTARKETLFIFHESNVGASYLTDFYGPQSDGCEVVCIPLDSITFPRVDWIKIDVEGSEVMMLLGAAYTIKKHRPKVICELNRSALSRMGYRYSHITEFFEHLNYRLEFLEPHHTLDMDQVDVLFLPK